MAGTIVLPQFVAEDGRSHATAADANVTVWPWNNTVPGNEMARQAAGQQRASTTVTAGPDVGGVGCVQVVYNDIWYFWAFNQSVTVPQELFNILTKTGSNYTVT